MGLAWPGYVQTLNYSITQDESTIKISWRRCTDSPVTNAIPPTVKIGDNVYAGYGLRKRGEAKMIFKYSLTQDTWSPLPDCPTFQHGLATLDDELIVIGGLEAGQTSNKVYTFRDKKWQQVLPPMPTPRCLLCTASYENRLILAAGGTTRVNAKGEVMCTDKVEIYKKDGCWYSTKRLPFPVYQFTMQIVGDTCYILGGVTHIDNSSTTLYTTVSSLLENAAWEKLQQAHPLTHPSLVELNGRLVVMGGSVDHKYRQGSKFISAYDSETDTWVECKGAELPLALYRPGLVNLGNNKVMLIGGQPRSQQFSKVAFIGCYIEP